MKKPIRYVMGASLVTLLMGTWTGVASATAAYHVPPQDLPPIYPAEGQTPNGALPASGPGVTVVGNCPAYLFGTPDGTNATDAVGFAFDSGNAHFYRLTTPGDPTTGQGANAEGTATLVIGDNPNPTITPYTGKTHLWFGSNTNANGHMYFGETISYHGTTPDGSHSITFTSNPGFNVSVSGNQNGWGVLKVTCSYSDPRVAS